MSATTRARLLKHALPLIKTHGFTRETLARSVLSLPSHSQPLSETAVSALFGRGDIARRTLIKAWLEDGLEHMSAVPGTRSNDIIPPSEPGGVAVMKQPIVSATLQEVLRARLQYNEPVLSYLPEAFALLASPASGVPPLDLGQALRHPFDVASAACYLTADQSLQLDWYKRRAFVSGVYAATELHQMTSPQTAYLFMDTLLNSSAKLESVSNEISLYASYIFKSWRGILKSSGMFV